MSTEQYVREPKQRRSILMKEKILDTAMKLFCEKGFYNTTTNEIAKTANISIGSLYSYFADKDTILMDLLELYNQRFLLVFEEIESEINLQLYHDDKREWLYWLVTKLSEMHESIKGFNREINILYYAKAEVALVLDAQSERVRMVTLDILNKHLEDFEAEDMEAASVVIVDYISALVDRIVFKDEIIEKERIIKTGVEIIYKYLY